ncbi:MAG: hypothetical protein R3B07_06925 [Polyangiaceae bacterium]
MRILWRMANSTPAWAALVCIGALGCSSHGSSAATEPDVDPADVTCETPAKFGCLISTQCRDFYTNASVELARTMCEEKHGHAYQGGCPTSFEHCCVVVTGANELPEGFCILDDNPQAQGYQASCESDPEPTFYCQR